LFGLPLGQNSSPLLISFCSEIPLKDANDNDLPEGLVLLNDFVDAELEEKLISLLKWNATETEESALKNRQVQHFGYEFIYGKNTVDSSCPLDNKIPVQCDELWKKLSKCTKFKNFIPDQLTVNKYNPGNGIPAHCDTHSVFEDPIISLSLGASIVMEFKNPEHEKNCSVLLPRRSLLVMSGDSRYAWTHKISPKMSDIDKNSEGFLTVQPRELRYSFTFRK
jgi:alkylated DNA repair protein alkB homolog 8